MSWRAAIFVLQMNRNLECPEVIFKHYFATSHIDFLSSLQPFGPQWKWLKKIEKNDDTKNRFIFFTKF